MVISDSDGRHRGFGFVTFKFIDSARRIRCLELKLAYIVPKPWT